jgi:hypothetical protein
MRSFRGRKALPLVSGAKFLFVSSGESTVTLVAWFAATLGFSASRRGPNWLAFMGAPGENLQYLLEPSPTA